MSGKSLASVRILLGCAFLAAFCLLFLESWDAPYLASWQIGPSILAINILALLVLAILTLLFGRIYCSLFCPLGLTQDFLGRLRRKRSYHKMQPFTLIRLFILVIFVSAMLLGISSIFALLDPYSAFGRIIIDLFSPVWNVAHNALSWVCRQFESYAILDVELPPQGWLAIGIASITLAALWVATWKHGRIWCNFCPVGTLLSLLSRFSLFRIRLDTTKCISCRRSERVCKTGCIDIAQKQIDASRCVACYNCIKICPNSALKYAPAGISNNHEATHPSAARRAMLLSLLPFAIAAPAASAVLAPGREDRLPVRKQKPLRITAITAPGSQGHSHFTRKCSGCQLCVSACPGNILSSFSNGLGILQPSLTFEYGYCLPGCTACGKICPTDAIMPFTGEQKKDIQLGIAAVDFDRCLVHTEEIPCQACHNICPQKVIALEKDNLPNDLRRPVVDTKKCIGCGACEFVCPARPTAAIIVHGNRVHKNLNI